MYSNFRDLVRIYVCYTIKECRECVKINDTSSLKVRSKFNCLCKFLGLYDLNEYYNIDTTISNLKISGQKC